MRLRQIRKLNPLIAAALSVATILAAAVFLAQGTLAKTAQIVWNGAPDRAVAVEIAAAQNTTRENATGAKIPSNAHSAKFPGIYFIWDSKQKDNGYLKVDPGIFDASESFTLTAKESNTYWDFVIAPQNGQSKTDDGCYVFFIPKAYGNKNINMVFIDGAVPAVTTTAKPTTTKKETTTRAASTQPMTQPTTTTATTTTTTTTTAAPAYSVITGNWISYSNQIALVNGNSYAGDFGSAVVEVGIRYAFEDPSMASPTWAAGAVGSPFGVWLSGVVEGAWYYAAYVKTADGDYFHGEVKMATYP